MQQIKKASAEGEDAWKNAGENVGLQIWRIVQFKVTHWPKEDYGKFYTGDSYIILNTYKKDPSSRVSGREERGSGRGRGEREGGEGEWEGGEGWVEWEGGESGRRGGRGIRGDEGGVGRIQRGGVSG